MSARIVAFSRQDDDSGLAEYLKTMTITLKLDDAAADLRALKTAAAFRCMIVYVNAMKDKLDVSKILPVCDAYKEFDIMPANDTARIVLAWLLHLVTAPLSTIRQRDFTSFGMTITQPIKFLSRVPTWRLLEKQGVVYKNVDFLFERYLSVLSFKRDLSTPENDESTYIDIRKHIHHNIVVHKCYKLARFLLGRPDLREYKIDQTEIWDMLDLDAVQRVFAVDAMPVPKALFVSAVRRNEPTIVKFCLDKGFDPNICVDVFDMTKPTESLLMFVKSLSVTGYKKQRNLIWQRDLLRYYTMQRRLSRVADPESVLNA